MNLLTIEERAEAIRALFGAGDGVKAKALEILTEMDGIEVAMEEGLIDSGEGFEPVEPVTTTPEPDEPVARVMSAQDDLLAEMAAAIARSPDSLAMLQKLSAAATAIAKSIEPTEGVDFDDAA